MANHGQLKEELKYEISGVILVALGILCIVSLLSQSSGLVSDFAVRILRSIAGEGCYFFPFLLVLAGGRLVRRRSQPVVSPRMYGVLLIYLTALTFFHLIIPLEDSFNAGVAGDGGGLLGALLSYLFRKSFGIVGTYIILVTAGLIALLLLTNLSILSMAQTFLAKMKEGSRKGFRGLVDYLFTEVEEDGDEQEHNEKEPQPPPLTPVIIDQGERVTIPESPAVSEQSVEGQAKNKKQQAASKNTAGMPEPAEDGLDDGPGITLEAAPGNTSYRLPPLSILSRPFRLKNTRLSKDINDNIRKLEETLESFGIKARVIQVSRGPAITRYEIQPPSGVKVSRIVSLADDIALSMAAPGVRIEAPIPGKAAVGIEIPNKETSMVHLRDLLETQEFVQGASKLTISLGKDIAGNPVVADLAKMPHLLIAGATGSGKSVCINTLIVSILFKATPEEVKFLMIDPKMVELAMYNGIPHLVSPVVIEPKKAATSLRWAVREMEQRYELFAAAGVRDITRYNKLCERNDQDNKKLPLPLIVVIIDELSDLMMVAPADVEDAVCRLAQMARAAGMHLLVATQRPSVDVITGLIKANIPSRISFAVSSQIDSRTILDMSGAEKLLGKGDMLFFPVGASKPLRVQGAYLSDREVENLVNYLKKQAEPVYNDKILHEEPVKEAIPEFEDELLPQAVQILIESGHASISLLQRRLHIGYARAARLIDMMEKKGIVGGYEGSKPRAILMTLEQYNQLFKNN
ncbi:DNA translocase FtsK [Pelotomaculum sp. PtaB.Bin117]|uniref:FtsK/SpoIIIE family DNA translocase n=1 Tax=Pelotomaculum sp. PtaB.Bin117 TaxID=1811694 RepID=UPI0009D10CA8|nr:DNA translocase FtsK [Pelotomaculum sp. PtaB.Bin117]OPX91311.1 MAG: DNA translocase SpoIIIE [Pelotomaculum sp. PtaB.Bin117]OPY60649.1 MAG: DNA translocase SpoIIIE [Pelotomaculum sp. PtaU1.Bin065]